MKRKPEYQFRPTRETVAHVLDHYGLKLVSYHIAPSGIENTTVIAQTSGGNVALRVYRQNRKSAQHIIDEINFVDYLRSHGTPTPRFIKNLGGEYLSIITIDNLEWQILLMEFVAGEHPKNYTKQLIDSISKTQAQMHILASDYVCRGSDQSVTVLKDEHFANEISTKSLNQATRDFLKRVATYQVPLGSDLPRGLCHLDYDSGNMLVMNEQLTAVLDFDDLAYAPFVVCLAYSLWHIHRQAGRDLALHYLQTYESLRPLSEPERRLLAPVKLFRHYVISSLQMLNGHIEPADINAYLEMEQELRSALNTT